MSDAKKPELVFAPGCFDDFDGTAEELAELIEQLHAMAESGELFENATPLTEEEEAEYLEKLESRSTRQ